MMSAAKQTQEETSQTAEQFNSLKSDIRYFFVNFSPDKIKSNLWELYKGWAYNSSEYVGTEDIKDMLFFYEQLRDFMGDACRFSEMVEGVRITNVSPAINEPADLQGVIAILVQAIKPEMIFRINQPSASENGSKVYTHLLIVLTKDDLARFAEYEPYIDFLTSANGYITCTLYQYSYFFDCIKRGHPYFSWAGTKANLAYEHGTSEIHTTPVDIFSNIVSSATSSFTSGISKAQSFYNNAILQLESGDAGLVMFLLHQAVELTFRTLAISLYGEDNKTHMIKSLKKLNNRLVPQLNNVFPDNTPEERRLLNLLDDAYLNSLHKAGYTVEKSDINLLIEKVAVLIVMAKKGFNEKIKVFDIAE